MPGVQDPNVIDLVGLEADGTYLLVIVEERHWGTDTRQPSQLREKINAYTGFVLDGTLAKNYPESAGKPIRIQLNCPQLPAGEIAAITNHARNQLDKLGIGFAVRILS